MQVITCKITLLHSCGGEINCYLSVKLCILTWKRETLLLRASLMAMQLLVFPCLLAEFHLMSVLCERETIDPIFLDLAVLLLITCKYSTY